MNFRCNFVEEQIMASKLDGDSKTAASKSDDDDGKPLPKKVCLSTSDIKELSREEIAARWAEMETYVEFLEDKEPKDMVTGESGSQKETEDKLKLQQQESTRRENVLVMRLATKEQEMQELLAQILELKQSQNPSTSQLKSTLLDPAVNLLFEKMKTEFDELKEKLEQAQNDLNAWKFTPDSVTGKKLMAKCRMLIQENQDLGAQLSQGQIAKLEAELAVQKKYSEELKSSQDELNDFVIQLDEEVEGMQSTICALQQQLKETKQQLQTAETENSGLRTKLASIEEKSRSHSEQNHVSKDQHRRSSLKDINDSHGQGNETSGRTSSHSHHDGEQKTSRMGGRTSFSISNLLSPEKVKTRSSSRDHRVAEAVSSADHVEKESRTSEEFGELDYNGELDDEDDGRSPEV